jgi:YtkA-like
MRSAILLVAFVPVLATAAEPCGKALGTDSARAESEHYSVVFRTVPTQVAVGRAFALEAQVCAKGAAPPATGLRVDARMPAHGHGMNYRPTIVPEGNGRFRAEGMLFHMPGSWEVIFDVDASGTHERVARDLQLE